MSQPRRSVRATFAALVATVLLLSGCSAYDLPLPGGANTGKDPIRIELMFRDVLDLVPHSSVKVDDVSVGRVTAVTLKDGVAAVEVELPKNIDLPANLRAEIRQTSLLGEKFVSLSRPTEPQGQLTNGHVVGLEHTGRNPEIEEVLDALALLLNGGGVAQLQTIARETNAALGGREDAVKSVISQTGELMAQLDDNKGSIITAMENLNRLALELRRQDDAIKGALDELPTAVASVNNQRDDLVKSLQAVEQLSDIGVKVIQLSKDQIITVLKDLTPALVALVDSGEYLTDSLQAVATYPFIDAAVGNDPKEARNLHMGDFVNLSIRLDLDLFNLPAIPGLPGGLSIANLFDTCKKTPLAAGCTIIEDLLSGKQLRQLCNIIPVLCPESARGNARVSPATDDTASDSIDVQVDQLDPFLLEGTGFDPALGTLLMQGVAWS